MATPDLGANFGELRGGGSIKNRRPTFGRPLMVYHHPENFAVLSMDEEEVAILLCLRTDKQTDIESKTGNNRSTVAERNRDQKSDEI